MHARWNRWWRAWRRWSAEDDGGGEVILSAGLVLALLVGIGLVVDGGGQLHAQDQARWTAEQAARAAGQRIDTGAATSGTIAVDRHQAKAAAEAVLAESGMAGGVRVSGDVLTVSTRDSYQPVFLRLIGIRSVGVSGQAQVRLVQTG